MQWTTGLAEWSESPPFILCTFHQTLYFVMCLHRDRLVYVAPHTSNVQDIIDREGDHLVCKSSSSSTAIYFHSMAPQSPASRQTDRMGILWRDEEETLNLSIQFEIHSIESIGFVYFVFKRWAGDDRKKKQSVCSEWLSVWRRGVRRLQNCEIMAPKYRFRAIIHSFRLFIYIREEFPLKKCFTKCPSI